MMRLLGVMLVSLATSGCGPHLKQHPVASRTYAAAPGATCGQELATATFVAKGAKWGESIRIEGCAYHGLDAYVEVSADREDMGRLAWNGMFYREGPPSARCAGGEVVSASPGSGSGGASAAGGKAGDSGTASASAAPSARAPAAMNEVLWGGEVCPNQMDTVMGLDRVKPGTTIEVRVWTKVPVDLTGLMLRITHNIDKPNVSDAEWEKHLAKEEAKRRKEEEKWRKQRREYEEPARRRDLDDEPTRAPPPPRAETRPPAPSAVAEWIPGYWHWKRDWYWVVGRWRVPDGAECVRAPHAPPPPRAESAPLAVGLDLVWTPGYWAWNGRSYVWIGGGWGRPPRAGMSWRPAAWRVSGGAAVFVPGGWHSR